MALKIRPDDRLLKAATEAPGGWVYEIDEAFAQADSVPPHAIRRAWEVDAQGRLTGKMITNPNHDSLNSDEVVE